MAELLKGKPVVDSMALDLRARIEALGRAKVVPALALVRVGQRPDDLSYERTARKRAESLGIAIRPYELDEFAPQAAIEAAIHEVNRDENVHGCLLFRPLPSFVDESHMCELLDPKKDIDGITLKEYMEYRAQPLTYKETLHFITQVLAALQHAHEKGIVHRDIKPQNIMLLADSTIKVMDFGIARFSRSENQTMTDKAIGSVHYISPEQAKGDTTDAKADIYSVGVMMYEMLSGKLPFESDSPVSVAIKQIADTATPLRELNPAVPEALAAITERAMAKEPRERYPSAQAMLADIDEFKRNPSVKFEYQYLTDTAPTRYIDKVVNKTATKQSGGQQRPRTGARPAARGGTKTKKRLALPILAGMAAAFLIGAAIWCSSSLNMRATVCSARVWMWTCPTSSA